ncbi:AI-2E family transporter, partial [Enterococcus faecalis]
YSIIGLFVLVVALIAWGSVVIIPKIQEQTVSFISNFPQYVDTIDNKLTEILRDPLFNQFREQLETAGDKFMNSAGDMIQDI